MPKCVASSSRGYSGKMKSSTKMIRVRSGNWVQERMGTILGSSAVEGTIESDEDGKAFKSERLLLVYGRTKYMELTGCEGETNLEREEKREDR
jgi:hypothetical protein